VRRQTDRDEPAYKRPMAKLVVVALTLALAALLGAARGSAGPVQEVKLIGSVGPEFTISLTDAQGNPVTKLDPGAYEIEVTDRSDFHNFHLTGPGVSEDTGVEFTGQVTWHVTFRDGSYVYVCDVHPSSMRGTFTAGTPPTTNPPPPGGGGGGGSAVTARTKLLLTSGPGFAITLKTAAGKNVKSMRTGTYTVVVRDRGRIHNAHVVAPGYNRRTTPLTYTGTQTWKVKLARAGTFRFLCDPHVATGMKGSAKIVR
jgi:plastocyanin